MNTGYTRSSSNLECIYKPAVANNYVSPMYCVALCGLILPCDEPFYLS